VLVRAECGGGADRHVPVGRQGVHGPGRVPMPRFCRISDGLGRHTGQNGTYNLATLSRTILICVIMYESVLSEHIFYRYIMRTRGRDPRFYFSPWQTHNYMCEKLY